MTSSASPDGRPRWLYDHGEGPPKHRWRNDYAGFKVDQRTREIVGKCASSIDQATAQELLNDGIPFPEAADEDDTPERIYAVYRGVIYEARPTVRGLSYHGYPWRGDLKGRRPLPKTILKRLRQMAEKTGHLPELERWLRDYSPRS